LVYWKTPRLQFAGPGLDTVDANLALGHAEDDREYSMAVAILKDLGIGSVKLLTNNPSKISDLESQGIEVTERIPLTPTVYADNAAYLWTKIHRMNHLIDLNLLSISAEGETGMVTGTNNQISEAFWLQDAQQRSKAMGRPVVTLSYAQSLDGCLTAEPGKTDKN
jgi:GTP cyclohydrolase II